jgi:hypothetical protein
MLVIIQPQLLTLFSFRFVLQSYRVTMMSSIHQKKTDSTDKIAVFYSDDGPGSKGLSVSYFEEYVSSLAIIIVIHVPFYHYLTFKH